MAEPSLRPAGARATLPELADPASAMTRRFNLFFRWFARRFFGGIDLDPDTVQRLRELEARGSVVYVMHYASRLDYFLFNTLFLRDGLRLSGFANGLRFYYYAPLLSALRRLVRYRPWRRRRAEEARLRAGEIVRAGGSQFLFLRTERVRTWLAGRRAVLRHRREREILDEIVEAAWSGDRPVFLVPLALFWRKGPRVRRRFLNLGYGSPARPSDLGKVLSFLVTYRGLFVKVGEPFDLGAFLAERREEGRAALVRKVRRLLLLFCYREEKVVEGPTLRPRQRVTEIVLDDPKVRQAVEARAAERRMSSRRARLQAERMVREVAANMNSTFLAVLSFVVTGIFRRMFASIEASGLDKVAEYAKRHPLVIAPSHRSYFDFLIISWLFYENHLVPPHIAARENMAFGPFGFVFRRAGAFFLRRSFEDRLYKEIFRSYVGYLVREGHTQEFFIEGGRSRTGKMLAPRLGMLAWDVEAFLAGARRDLFFVPVALTYEHLVEEEAMVHELEGAGKREESVIGLVRARKVLRRRFGSVYVRFGEPISLAQQLGDRRARFARAGTPEELEERRRFIEDLGELLAWRINWCTIASATSVAACALLGERRRGMFRHELVRRMQDVVDLLSLQGVGLTPGLARDQGEFRESIAVLLRRDLIRRMHDERGEILFYEEGWRQALDLYRNAIVHYLAVPSFLARRLRADRVTPGSLRADLEEWLDLLRLEYFTPRDRRARDVALFLDEFERRGCLERRDGELCPTEKGRGYFDFLAALTQSVVEVYYAACTALLFAPPEATRRDLEREIAAQFERGMVLGEVERREAANRVTFANAIQRLERLEVIERGRPEGRDAGREGIYTRGPRYDRLRGLRERLAADLPSR